LSVGSQHLFFINGQLQTIANDYDISGVTLTINVDRPAPTYSDILKLYGSIGVVSVSSGAITKQDSIAYALIFG
jgi:hypothetical protein